MDELIVAIESRLLTELKAKHLDADAIDALTRLLDTLLADARSKPVGLCPQPADQRLVSSRKTA